MKTMRLQPLALSLPRFVLLLPQAPVARAAVTFTTLHEVGLSPAPTIPQYGDLVQGSDGNFLRDDGGWRGQRQGHDLQAGHGPDAQFTRLAISQSGASALVSWTSSGTAGFNLEEAGTLGGYGKLVPHRSRHHGQRHQQVRDPPHGSSNQFFRLRKP